ncbi:MAG: glycosyltransferase family A protein [Thermoplasmatales archaeon]
MVSIIIRKRCDFTQVTKEKVPLISVVVPAFDRKEYLLEALTSIKEQSLRDDLFEVIVSKNFEDEKIDSEISSLGFKSTQCSGSMGERLAQALDLSRGQIISFLQDDDIFEKDKLSTIMELFIKYDKVNYIHNAYSKIDSFGNMLTSKIKTKDHRLEIYKNCEDEKKLKVLIKNQLDFNLSCISIRKEIVVRYLSLLKKITGADDTFMFAISAISCQQMLFTDSTLTRYRIHNSATVKNGTFKEMLLNNSFTFDRQIRTLSLLKDEFNDTYLKNVLKEGVNYRIAAKNIIQFEKLNRSQLFNTTLELIKNHKTLRSGFYFKLLLGNMILLINQVIAKMIYYCYTKIRYLNSFQINR